MHSLFLKESFSFEAKRSRGKFVPVNYTSEISMFVTISEKHGFICGPLTS